MNDLSVSLSIFFALFLGSLPEITAQSRASCDEAYSTLYKYTLDLEKQNQEYSNGLEQISNSLNDWLQSSTDSLTWSLMGEGITRLGLLDSSMHGVNMKFASQIDEMSARNQSLDSLNTEFEDQIRSMKKLNKGKLILVGGIGFLLGTVSHRVFIRPRS